MENPEKKRVSFYTEFFDKEVPQACYAAIIYAVLMLMSGVVSWFALYDPEKPHTGTVALVYSIISIIVAAVSGVFAFFIFRRSRVAIVLMIAFITVLQLFTWLAHSLKGTLPFIIITAFLLRGDRRMFQDHAERQLEATKEV